MHNPPPSLLEENMEKKIDKIWNFCVGAGRANEGLRAEWQNQLKTCVKECGFRYVRFHGIFHDDMFVYRETDGVPEYNYMYVDQLIDALLRNDIKPFLELGFMPSDMASGDNTFFGGNAILRLPKI